jgi:hypothetical protein
MLEFALGIICAIILELIFKQNLEPVRYKNHRDYKDLFYVKKRFLFCFYRKLPVDKVITSNTPWGNYCRRARICGLYDAKTVYNRHR